MSDYLASKVKSSLDNMYGAVCKYIYEGDRSAYQTVATELRKLLLDKNAPKSWDKRTKSQSLFELVYGRRDGIYVSELPSDGTLAVFDNPAFIPACVADSDNLITMKEWLAQRHITSRDGVERTTEWLLRDIADKEGAHIIGGGAGWKGFGMGLSAKGSDDLQKGEDVMEIWRQLVVFAGIQLLMSRRYEGAYTVPLVMYQWAFPCGPDGEEESPWGLLASSFVTLNMRSGIVMKATRYGLRRL